VDGWLEAVAASIHQEVVAVNYMQVDRGGGGGHVEGYSAAGDPPHDITGVGPV
jgi:hypothetical protein